VIKFEKSDAWIFLSVAYSVQKQQSATLDLFFSSADCINHAIPTNDEIQGGINRLASADTVYVKDNKFSLTKLGQQLFEKFCRQTSYPLEQLDLVKQFFETQNLQEVAHSVWHLSSIESERAFEIYRQRGKEALKKVLKK
jgi:hypothetical protein